jgi:hypothetical protein
VVSSSIVQEWYSSKLGEIFELH